MGLLYQGSEKRVGRDLSRGANIPMQTNPDDYGVNARALILQIAMLMISKKVELNYDNFRNPVASPRSGHQLNGDDLSIIGWFDKLASDDKLSAIMASMINDLVNLVLKQMNDREATLSYPNEDMEAMINMGYSLWDSEVDP